MGQQKRPVCVRGHAKDGANFKLKERGSACRACECALSQAHNHKARYGLIWTERDLQWYADIKFEEIRAGGL